ncbi:hypothetical protein BpHYR1_037038 [Brachionus plicatilis]|uniref:Uncharacterized protein n=1 Tax=Brachionus plicatilis TaxID=10195 RepID=A0A3M7SMK7_BRAPC|nr:hypothetical protein BpHYR1_037038 [Brachionus plicatilis]
MFFFCSFPVFQIFGIKLKDGLTGNVWSSQKSSSLSSKEKTSTRFCEICSKKTEQNLYEIS